MPLVEQYPVFLRRLPEPPTGTPPHLVNIFRPTLEPDLDTHFARLSELQEWLDHQTAAPVPFPEDVRTSTTDIGGWVRICNSRWIKRYQSIGMRSEQHEKISNGVFSGALITALGAVGLDGAIDTILEWIAPIGATLARVGIPVPIARTKARALRNEKLAVEIKGALK